MLLPVHGSPLQACYCGPFTVDEKVNSVDYIISTPGHCKAKRLCHVNMKAYHETPHMQGIPKTVNVVTLPSNNSSNVTHQMMTDPTKVKI